MHSDTTSDNPQFGLSRKIELKWVIILLALALLVRCSNLVYRVPIWGDEPSYRMIAVNILEGKGFQEGHYYAWRYPGYCYFIAGTLLLEKQTGSEPFAARTTVAAQILMSVLGCYLLYRVIKQIFGSRAALIALALITFYIPQIRLPGRLFSENLSLPLFLLFWCIYISFRKRPSFLNVLGMGVCAGVVGLCRETALAFILVVLIAELATRMRAVKLSALAPIFGVFLFLGLTLSPWLIRNYLLFHEITSITTNAPINIYYGAQPNATGFCPMDFLGPPYSLVLVEPPNTSHRHDPANGIYEEIEVGRSQLQASIDYVRHNPLAWTLLGFKKAAYSWVLPSMTFFNPQSKTEKIFAHIWDANYILILIPGLMGAWRLRRRFFELLPGYSTLIVPTFLSILTVVLTRYRMPTDFGLILFASVQYAFWWEGRFSHSSKTELADASLS
jgi:4-amino-4-deoxy-L-arabinose transferase-like glycosyltransferase